MQISAQTRQQLAVASGRGDMRALETLLRNLPIDTPSDAIADVSEVEGAMTAAERVKFNAVLAVLRKFEFIAA